MKLKNFLVLAFIGLSVSACNEEARDFSGDYEIASMTIKVSRISNNKYETIFIDKLFTSEMIKITEIKDGNRLYETNGHYLGEFTDAGLKMAGGAFYEKVSTE